jgi:hypothetical protein
VPRIVFAGYLAAVAAGVIGAFGLGLLSGRSLLGSNDHSVPAAVSAAASDQPVGLEGTDVDGIPGERVPESEQPIMASFTAHPGHGSVAETTFQVPVVPASGAPAEATDVPDDLPDYVRQQWERRGFAVATQRRYLFATLPSGERVVVPVENIQFNRLPVTVY